MMILFERPAARPVTLAPRIVFAEPVMIPRAVLTPTAVLLEPDTLSNSENHHKAVLFDPVIFDNNAE